MPITNSLQINLESRNRRRTGKNPGNQQQIDDDNNIIIINYSLDLDQADQPFKIICMYMYINISNWSIIFAS